MAIPIIFKCRFKPTMKVFDEKQDCAKNRNVQSHQAVTSLINNERKGFDNFVFKMSLMMTRMTRVMMSVTKT